MQVKTVRLIPSLGCLIMLQSAPLAAQDYDPMISLSLGTEFTSGTYGGDVDIEDNYVPLTAVVDYGNIAFRLTVPYLSVYAPEGTIIGPDGEPLPGSGEMTTESGLGDLVAGVTLFDVIHSRRLGLAMDLTGVVKFGTADENKGLGTGENDYTVRADIYKFVDQFTWIGSVGYRFRGDTADLVLNDVAIASLGGTYRFTPDASAGLFFDFRDSAISGNDSIQELSGFVSHRIGEDWRLQVYALTGFTDSSPDWGAGIKIKRVLKR